MTTPELASDEFIAELQDGLPKLGSARVSIPTRRIRAPLSRLANAERRGKTMRKALIASAVYLRNAQIDLQTGATKATAIRTIEGGLRLVESALEASQ